MVKKCVRLKIPRLDSSDLLIAQWLERQTSIHEVVGSRYVRYRDVGHLDQGTCWLRGLGVSCYVYVCTRHVIWDDARGRVIVCVHRAGKSAK